MAAVVVEATAAVQVESMAAPVVPVIVPMAASVALLGTVVVSRLVVVSCVVGCCAVQVARSQ